MTKTNKIAVWVVLAAAAALVAALTGGSVISPVKTGDDSRLAAVNKGTFDITVNTVGVLDAERSHVVSSTIKGDNGKIASILDEGTFVKKGDVLIRFDTVYFEAESLRLTGELRSREASFEARKQILEWEKSQAEGAIKAAEFDLKDAMQEHGRYVSYISDMEELGKKGLHYPSEIVQARKKAEQLFARQQKCAASFEQISKESVFKIAAAMAELAKAKNEIETTKISRNNLMDEIAKAVVYAPFPGIVVHCETQRDNQKRKPRVGDTAWQNQPLLYLPDISSMIVKTRVREVDLHKIAKGQKASVQVDAYPERVLAGQVNSIGVMASDDGEADKGEKLFQVVVSIQGESPDLRPGMTCRIVVHVDTARDVLAVPVQAVFIEGVNRYCYVREGESVNKVPVVLGRQNDDQVEIVSGLKQGNSVFMVRPSGAVVDK